MIDQDAPAAHGPLVSRRVVVTGALAATAAIVPLTKSSSVSAPRATLAKRPNTAGGATNPADIARAKGLCFGSAISNTPFRDSPAYRDLYAKYCNTMVHGSALQWHELQQAPGQPYDFTRAEAMYRWAHGAGKALRGHAMLDWAGIPTWLPPQVAAATPSQAAELLKAHVTALATHWRGRFIQWNVANEPVSGGMRNYCWFDKLGEQYLDLAFATAHAIDPATPLAINQNLIEMDNAFQRRSRESLLELVQRLKTRKVPIASVGIEGHLLSGVAVDQTGLDAFCRALAGMGVSFMVTELDVDDRHFPGDVRGRDADVAALVRDFLDVTLAQPRCEGLIVWDMSDHDNWITRDTGRARSDALPQRPALLDAAYKPKPVWQAVTDALARAPGPGKASILPRG